MLVAWSPLRRLRGHVAAAVLLLLDFLPFYGIAFETLHEIKCKQSEDRGEEEKMSPAGGDGSPPLLLVTHGFHYRAGEEVTHKGPPWTQTSPTQLNMQILAPHA